MHLFLKNDYDALKMRLGTIRDQDRAVGKIIGESMGQSSETYHDNFDFEQGTKERLMLGEALVKLRRVYQHAEVYDPPIQNDHIDIGSTAVLEDLVTKEVVTVTLGSYMILSKPDSMLSYVSPLGELLYGKRVGDEIRLELANHEVSYLIRSIRQ